MEDYEKKYKDALVNARQEYTTTENVERKQWLEELFPELKESEDERIRKALIRFHKSTIDVDGIKGEEVIDWLEKQGEHKQEWSEEDEEMAEDLIKGCVSAESPYQLTHTCKEITDWLKSIKDRIKGKED